MPTLLAHTLTLSFRSSVSGVRYSDTNFPSEISVPFETNSQSLFTDRALLMSSCTWSGLLTNNLSPISRQRLYSSQIPSGCLPHFCRRASRGKAPVFVWRSLLHTFHEIVSSLSQLPTTFRPSPSLVRKSTVQVEVTGVLWGCSRSLVVTHLFHVNFCIHFPDAIISHLTGESGLQFWSIICWSPHCVPWF